MSFVDWLGCGNAHRKFGVFVDCVVVNGDNPRHMQRLLLCLDVSKRHGVLRCVSYLGFDRATKDFRGPGNLREGELVLPGRSHCSSTGVVGGEELPATRVDKTDKHASADRCHWNDASCDCSELQQLDHCGVSFWFCGVQVQARVVEASQLCALWGTRCRACLHGSASVSLLGVGGHWYELVGK